MRILKEQGIDPKAQAQAYKIAYEIPPLDMGKQKNKVRTPVTQVFKELDMYNIGGQNDQDADYNMNNDEFGND